MHSDREHRPANPEAIDPQTDALSQAIVKSLDQACAQLPAATQAALAAGRARALGKQKANWPWAVAASLLLALGVLTWHAQPQDADAMALEILQADDQLLSEIDLIESLAEVDET